MNAVVKLVDLTDALDLPEEWDAWLDHQTGRIITLDPDTRSAAETDDPEDAPAMAPTISNAEQVAARAIADGDPRYLALPDKFDFHEYRHMERFIGTVADTDLADQLWRAIKGQGAFRHFKDTAHRRGVIDAWYRYRDEAMQRHMLDWAEVNGVTVDQTPRRPGKP